MKVVVVVTMMLAAYPGAVKAQEVITRSAVTFEIKNMGKYRLNT